MYLTQEEITAALRDGKTITEGTEDHRIDWTLTGTTHYYNGVSSGENRPFLAEYMTAEYLGQHLAKHQRLWGGARIC